MRGGWKHTRAEEVSAQLGLARLKPREGTLGMNPFICFPKLLLELAGRDRFTAGPHRKTNKDRHNESVKSLRPKGPNQVQTIKPSDPALFSLTEMKG